MASAKKQAVKIAFSAYVQFIHNMMAHFFLMLPPFDSI
jgi:hypothetical protein